MIKKILIFIFVLAISTSLFAKDRNEVFYYASEAQTAIGTSYKTLLSSTEIGNYKNLSVWLKNTDAVDPMVDIVVEVSPDGTNGWTDMDTGDAIANNLAAGVTDFFEAVNKAWRYIRVRGKAATANPTATTCWLIAN